MHPEKSPVHLRDFWRPALQLRETGLRTSEDRDIPSKSKHQISPNHTRFLRDGIIHVAIHDGLLNSINCYRKL